MADLDLKNSKSSNNIRGKLKGFIKEIKNNNNKSQNLKLKDKKSLFEFISTKKKLILKSYLIIREQKNFYQIKKKLWSKCFYPMK